MTRVTGWYLFGLVRRRATLTPTWSTRLKGVARTALAVVPERTGSWGITCPPAHQPADHRPGVIVPSPGLRVLLREKGKRQTELTRMLREIEIPGAEEMKKNWSEAAAAKRHAEEPVEMIVSPIECGAGGGV